MPNAWSLIDSAFPTYTGKERPSEQIPVILNYMFMLAEGLKYQMNNLNANNWNSNALEELKIETTADLVQAVSVMNQELQAAKKEVAQLKKAKYIIGAICPFGGNALPEGYLLCDGAEYSRTKYARLFAVIGTFFGAGDGNTTFNVPDMRKRVPVGTGNGYGLGSTGGEEKHVLTENEGPTHNHYFTLNTNHSDGTYVEAEALSCAMQWTGRERYYAYTRNAGGGAAHNNMQPYTVMNYMICAGVED